jgi:hypothetical protein
MEAAHRAISNRYRHVQEEIPVTLARLSTSATFRETLTILREQEWKDWHILQAIANVFYNFHIQDWIRTGMSQAEVRRRLDALRQNPVELARLEVSSPIPLAEFSADRLETILKVSVGATMKGLGLSLNDERIDVDAIMSFMGERFNFWEEDVEHLDPFAPPPSGIILPAPDA